MFVSLCAVGSPNLEPEASATDRSRDEPQLAGTDFSSRGLCAADCGGGLDCGDMLRKQPWFTSLLSNGSDDERLSREPREGEG